MPGHLSESTLFGLWLLLYLRNFCFARGIVIGTRENVKFFLRILEYKMKLLPRSCLREKYLI